MRGTLRIERSSAGAVSRPAGMCGKPKPLQDFIIQAKLSRPASVRFLCFAISSIQP
jgi:hypothetical protein